MLKPQLASPTNRESYVRINRSSKAKTNTLFTKEIYFQYRAQASLMMPGVCPEDIEELTQIGGAIIDLGDWCERKQLSKAF